MPRFGVRTGAEPGEPSVPGLGASPGVIPERRGKAALSVGSWTPRGWSGFKSKLD